jgi:superfamily I DNA/RNA helicase
VQQAHAWPRKLAGPDPERGANSVIHGVCGWMTTLLKQRREDIEESSKSGSARRDALDTQIDILEMARNSLESANGTLQQRLFRVRNREKPEGASIALSTFHGSKGLEWEVVFLVDVHGGSVPNLDEAATDNDVAEERRVFYVAMTRAKERLHITYAESVPGISKWGNPYSIDKKPTPFLRHIANSFPAWSMHSQTLPLPPLPIFFFSSQKPIIFSP